ncbi:glycosyltransferase [Nocardia sp. NPDC049149]|uniref:glycosyltransferase n=1 Tax=Nocardia sp. NPDC049149 TaxID=3364315 RepID=UPI00371A60A6
MGRYLVAASPIPGHVLPMITVAGALRQRGHRVRMLSGAAFRDTATDQNLLLSALPAEPVVRPTASRHGPRVIRRWRTGRAELRSAFLAPLAAQYAALVTELGRADYDAVLVDSMFTGAIPLLVSGGARPPVLVCGVGPLTLCSTDCPPFGIGWQPVAGRDYSAMNTFVRQVLFRADQGRLDAAIRQLGAGSASVFLLDWPVLADRLLQFSVPGFEYPRRDLPHSVVFTGPIPGPAVAETALPPWWDALMTGKRIIHVTQGTWDNGDLGHLLRPTLAALGRRSDLVVVASTGGSRDRLGPLPSNAYVSKYVSYPQLLPHVDVMITNGGYGGVQQALSYGVPLIVAGENADKPEIAARVAYTGSGIDLRRARPSSAAIASAVDQVLGDKRFRIAAQRIAAEISRSSPFDTIAAVLEELGATPAVRQRECPPVSDIAAGRQRNSP